MLPETISKSCVNSTNILPTASHSLVHREYINCFIQRSPSYGLKQGGIWSTVNDGKPEKYIKEHLNGINNQGNQGRIIGTRSKWYPKYAILDIDDRNKYYDLPKIRKDFLLDHDSSSITFETSENSFHVLFRPEYKGKPVTLKLLQTILEPYAKLHKIELYPQNNRLIRAPFHAGSKVLRIFPRESNAMNNVSDFMSEFSNLTSLDLNIFNAHKRETKKFISSNIPSGLQPTKGVMKQGFELYKDGLTESNSRYEAQHKVAMYLWSLNFTPDQAEEELMGWLCEKHNGYSKDALAIESGDSRTLSQVEKEHRCLIDHIWHEFEKMSNYPNSTHNEFHGWFTKADLITSAKICAGNIPQFKFMAKLLAYFNCHRKTRLSVHQSKLVDWSSRNAYAKYLENFEESGILLREKHYMAGKFSKVIQLNGLVKPSMLPIEQGFYDGYEYDLRAMSFKDSLEDMGRKEVYEMLTANGFSKQQVYQFVEHSVL